jgi:hypothetical protein
LSPDIWAGVVFPEAGINWLINEINTLRERPLYLFPVRNEDTICFKKNRHPFLSEKAF